MADGVSRLFDQNELFERVDTMGPFVNMRLDYRKAAPTIINEVAELGDKYGHARDAGSKNILIDYSSPNVAKNMTVAHLRSTIIGHTLTKIHEAAGAHHHLRKPR
jgi:arginyl-tRNA synthetase